MVSCACGGGQKKAAVNVQNATNGQNVISVQDAENMISQIVKAAGVNKAGAVKDLKTDLGIEYPLAGGTRSEVVESWLEKYGESIYGTTAGIVPPMPWGYTTQKADTLYLHILLREEDPSAVHSFGYGFKFIVKLPLERERLGRCQVLNEPCSVGLKKNKNGGTTLALGISPTDPDTIVKIILNH